ncbi:hypothetical protein Pmani_027693, partial [Petrolisthes manimaculis]
DEDEEEAQGPVRIAPLPTS